MNDHLSLWRSSSETTVPASSSSSQATTSELLTTILGPRYRLPCERLVTQYENLRELAGAWPAELRNHGLTTGAIARSPWYCLGQ